MNEQRDKFLTPEEVADIFKITRRSVLELIRSGRLKAVQVGVGNIRNTYRIYSKEVDRFMSENYERYEE
jgi:excisionase family DNA binding protein